MLAYYTRRENMLFAVGNRARTTSKTPARLLIINFFSAVGLMSLYIKLTSPSYMRKLPNVYIHENEAQNDLFQILLGILLLTSSHEKGD
jgi:hypothetical protein